MSITIVGGGNPSGPTFPVQRSVRLRSSASAYFSRTPASAGSLTTWTWSGWVKPSQTTTGTPTLFGVDIAPSSQNFHYFTFSNAALDYIYYTTSVIARRTTTQVFRDPSAWYHLVFVWDTTNATASNRMRIYVNGVQVTAFSATTDPSLNLTGIINSANLHSTGSLNYDGTQTQFYDGYLTEVNFVDGQALTPTSFGAYNNYGVWSPAKYSGTYGTNGFYLNFQDNSAATAAAIGKDSSGNGNNWTPNNISVTAGVTYDSMLDVPTLTSANNANFAVMNPLNVYGATITNGNLQASTTNTSNDATNFSTVQLTSGKWYAEFLLGGSSSTSTSTGVGVSAGNTGTTYNRLGQLTNGMMYKMDGNKESPSGITAYGSTYTYGDLIGIALDLDASPPTITFYKNNTSQGSINLNSGSASTGYVIGCTVRGSAVNFIANFGAGSGFTYTPPSGFKSLNTYNLPAPTIPNGATQFAATLYTGTGAAQSITNTVNGVSMQPDFVWIKSRNNIGSHQLIDSVRGIPLFMFSDATNGDTSRPNSFTSFNSNGFTVGSSSDGNTNLSTYTYVAWQWKANGTPAVVNTSGSIPSTISANTTAGFSIVTFTTPASGNFTVGHGLGIAPAMVILKTRSGVDSWYVYNKNFATPTTGYLQLNSTAAVATSVSLWGSTNPSSSVVTLGTGGGIAAAATGLLYCFSEIPGFSKFGSYTGNASTDGPFIYTGMRPRWVLIKRSDGISNWIIYDTSRNTYNIANSVLFPDSTSAEATGYEIDILSNGFKIRYVGGNPNISAATYIYAAFAESPFNYSLAR